MKKRPRRVKIRRRWGRNPTTRVVTSRKVYNRKRSKSQLQKDLEREIP